MKEISYYFLEKITQDVEHISKEIIHISKSEAKLIEYLNNVDRKRVMDYVANKDEPIPEVYADIDTMFVYHCGNMRYTYHIYHKTLTELEEDDDVTRVDFTTQDSYFFRNVDLPELKEYRVVREWLEEESTALRKRIEEDKLYTSGYPTEKFVYEMDLGNVFRKENGLEVVYPFVRLRWHEPDSTMIYFEDNFYSIPKYIIYDLYCAITEGKLKEERGYLND